MKKYFPIFHSKQNRNQDRTVSVWKETLNLGNEYKKKVVVHELMDVNVVIQDEGANKKRTMYCTCLRYSKQCKLNGNPVKCANGYSNPFTHLVRLYGNPISAILLQYIAIYCNTYCSSSKCCNIYCLNSKYCNIQKYYCPNPCLLLTDDDNSVISFGCGNHGIDVD